MSGYVWRCRRWWAVAVIAGLIGAGCLYGLTRLGTHGRGKPARTGDEPEPATAQAAYAAAERELAAGRVAAAEQHLRQALQLDLSCENAEYRLAYLLGCEGRCWEAESFLLAGVRQGRFTLHHLVLLGALEPVIRDPALVQLSQAGESGDLLPLLGVARTAIKENQTDRAWSLLRRILAARPECLEAQARWGSLLLDGEPDDFLDWHNQLPTSADEHPEIWVVRGAWARDHNEPRVAVRCLLQAVRLAANHYVAHLELGRLFSSLGNAEQGRLFSERAEQLRQLGFLVDEIYRDPQNPALLQRAAELTETLGRLWEARAWAELALQLQPYLDWAQATVRRLRTQLAGAGPGSLPTSSLASQIELTLFPLPAWNKLRRQRMPVAATPSLTRPCQVAFEDMAKAVGIDFTYRSGIDPQTKEMCLLATTGGGVAVLDYDGDGWPDLYFTQGGSWPWISGQTPNPYRDRLYRNLSAGQFEDVTQSSGLGDDRYSQGVSVGDFNNDGFPDLYVANFGANRLYRNNGDGTFTDVTTESGLHGERWTTSCLIADLNGDGNPDLYDVNYLSSEDAARSICRKGEELRWCSPSSFAAEPDQLYLNLGDGRFEDISESAGILAPSGKGLGIVAADFAGVGKLNLFVANDAEPNFYFVNQTEHPGGRPQFEERALLSGLACNEDGLPQACMGVAADDADGDGLLDLFVTTFYQQAKILFTQRPGNLFIDNTRQAGLRDVGFYRLGFGTQFLDGELDGWPDLVIANGHVLDLSAQGVPHKMRPQYLRNLGHGRFAEIPASSLGPFFEGEYLGRGLARLDWNQDGREDFVVSHTDAPAALVTNRTKQAGHFLAVKLCGVVSSRDAIGTTVRLTAAGRTLVRQLTAGDGFQASNERQLIFGLGPQNQIGELRVVWPSGLQQIFRDVPVDRHLLLIEGRAEAAVQEPR
ncbi:MAG: FG-GAP-like repeat-containing protein [Planctomycetota bacterium]|nr:FG-GAP-like repeat-containing protein [Planctomycetota bacterium]